MIDEALLLKIQEGHYLSHENGKWVISDKDCDDMITIAEGATVEEAVKNYTAINFVPYDIRHSSTAGWAYWIVVPADKPSSFPNVLMQIHKAHADIAGLRAYVDACNADCIQFDAAYAAHTFNTL